MKCCKAFGIDLVWMFLSINIAVAMDVNLSNAIAPVTKFDQRATDGMEVESLCVGYGDIAHIRGLFEEMPNLTFEEVVTGKAIARYAIDYDAFHKGEEIFYKYRDEDGGISGYSVERAYLSDDPKAIKAASDIYIMVGRLLGRGIESLLEGKGCPKAWYGDDWRLYWNSVQRITVASFSPLIIEEARSYLHSSGVRIILTEAHFKSDERGLIGAALFVPREDLGKERESIIAIDLGGTNLRGGCVSRIKSTGRIIPDVGMMARHIKRARRAGSREEIVEQIINMVIQVIQDGHADAIPTGDKIVISTPGTLDAKGYVIADAPNLPHWDDASFHLPTFVNDELTKRGYVGYKIYILNDGQAAGLSEREFNMDVAEWAYIGLGTGLGSVRFSNFKRDVPADDVIARLKQTGDFRTASLIESMKDVYGRITSTVNLKREVQPIEIGPSSFRGIIGHELTLHNVDRLADAVARQVLEEGTQDRGVIVGYDGRLFSKEFADEIASVLVANNIKVYLVSEPTPTFCISLEVQRRGAAYGICVTASHLPAFYNGFILIGRRGNVAFQEEYEPINRRISQTNMPIHKAAIADNAIKDKVLFINARQGYFEELSKWLEPNLELLKKAKLRIVVDLMHGAQIGYFDKFLDAAGIDVHLIHNFPDPAFGGLVPDPTLTENLVELCAKVKELDADIGIAFDGDGDRAGFVTKGGEIITVDKWFPLLVGYLLKERDELKGGSVARMRDASHFTDVVVRANGGHVYETDVNAASISREFLDAKKNIVLGGGTNGGIQIKGVQGKDGGLSSIFMLGMLAKSRRPLADLLMEYENQFGIFEKAQVNIKNVILSYDSILECIKGLNDVSELKVKSFDIKDGIKATLEDGGWFLVRMSKTEFGLLRISAEAVAVTKTAAIARARNIVNFLISYLDLDIPPLSYLMVERPQETSL